MEDTFFWLVTKSGKFTVKSLYYTSEPNNGRSFPMCRIWLSWVQPRVSFFAWELEWGNVLTFDQI